MRKRAYYIIISSLAKRTAIFLWIIFLSSFSATALADMQLNPGEVQLDVAGILLDVESTSVIDDIGFSDNDFTVTMSAGQSLHVSSADRREFDVSPTTYITVTRSCNSSESTLKIEVISGTSGSISFTVTPKSTTCVIGGGGGGGAGAGAGIGVITPTEVLIPTEILVPPTEEIITPPEIPTEILPPAEIIPEVIEVPPLEIIEIPPAEEAPPAAEAPYVPAETTVQAVQAIGSGIVSAAGSIGNGIVQVFRGATSGIGGSGFIIKNMPNTGIYSWKTDQPLVDISGLMPLIPTERNDYKITVRSSTAVSVQDTSDKLFSLIKNNLSTSQVDRLRLNRKELAQVGEFNNPSITILAPNGGEIWTLGETYSIVWTWQNLPEPHQVDIILSRGFDAVESIKKINAEVTKAVKELRKDPVVTQTVKDVGVPLSVTVTAASAGAITITASAGSATMALNITEFFQVLSFARFYLFGLIRFKRRTPWGRIIDKFSGKPLRGATVQIWEAEYKKIKDTQLTDDEGRFGALVAPGKYYLKVSKKGFETKESGLIEITSPKQILNIEIALLPSEAEFSLSYIKKINFLNTLKRFIDLINPYLLAAGTIISFIILVIVPNALNYAVFFIYLGLDFLKIYLARALLKPFGKVIDELTGEPLSLAVVRIFEEEKNWLLATKVSDELGRFNFLLTPGRYYFTCSKAEYAPYRSDTIILTKAGLATIDIKLQSISGTDNRK